MIGVCVFVKHNGGSPEGSGKAGIGMRLSRQQSDLYVALICASVMHVLTPAY